MLDLDLFRKPAFNGVSAVAFGLSAGMFAMFLYLTIYMQGVLGYSPLEAGLRFLPLTVLSFVVAPIAGALSHRIPIRVLLGVGLALVGVGLLLMHGARADSDLDDAAGRLPRRRDRDRHHQPGHRPGGDRRRPGREIGDGLGDQHDLPPGRDRHRRRRRSARSSSPGSTRSCAELLPHAPDGLGEVVASGGSRAVAELPCRPAVTPKSVHAADVAFVSGFNEILLIAAILSFVGAALGFVLVRSQRLRPARPIAPRRSRAERARPTPGHRGLSYGSAAPAARQGACSASCGSRTCS